MHVVCVQGSDRWNEVTTQTMHRLPGTECTLRDWQSSEFQDIVESVSTKKKKKKCQPDYQKTQMKKLAELLDAQWDKVYAQRLKTRVYDSKDESYLEISVASTFSKFLVQQAWLPSSLSESSKVLFRGSELFDGAAVKRLLHTHAPYLDAGLKSANFLKHLSIQRSVTKQDLLGFLERWSEGSTHGATGGGGGGGGGGGFLTSIDHMCNVYDHLLADRDQDIIDKFSDGARPLIFVPNRYDDRVSTSVDIEGEFKSIHDVCWLDPSSVLYTKQKFNRPLPDSLPKVLSLHYKKQLQDSFISVGVKEAPNIRAFVVLLKYLSSLSVSPGVEEIRDFTSIVTHLMEYCQGNSDQSHYLLNNLKGKIFPSHRKVWVSLDDCLLDNDDQKLAKTFSREEKVHFVQWPPNFTESRRSRDKALVQGYKEEFLQLCKIEKLSERVCTEIDYGVGKMFMPIDEMKARISLWVPLIQQYIFHYWKNQYDLLVNDGIIERLRRLQVTTVLELKCLYFIEHGGSRLVSSEPAPRPCALDIDVSGLPTIYVADKKKDKPPTYLFEPLTKLFMSGVEEDDASSDFQDFLRQLTSELPENQKDIDDLAQDYRLTALSESEVKWEVPLPRKPQEEVEETSSEESESEVDNHSASEDDGHDEDRPMTCWPPKAAIDPIPSRKKQGTLNVGGAPRSDADTVIGEAELKEVREKHLLEKPGRSDGGRSDGGRSDGGRSDEVHTGLAPHESHGGGGGGGGVGGGRGEGVGGGMGGGGGGGGGDGQHNESTFHKQIEQWKAVQNG